MGVAVFGRPTELVVGWSDLLRDRSLFDVAPAVVGRKTMGPGSGW